MEALKNKSFYELEDFFIKIGEPKYRAKQTFLRIHQKLANSIDDLKELSVVLRERLKATVLFDALEMQRSTENTTGTEKATFVLPNRKTDKQKLVEAVWIETPTRNTVCVSSQVGCSLNCSFCATGTLPFYGNLEPWEIIEQVYAFTRLKKQRVTNVVFMGMGEPFYNYDNVIKAANLLNDPDGLNIGARHITISTSGVVDKIERFIQEEQPYNLAISLNHVTQEERVKIMDISEKFPLNDLLKVARDFTRNLGRRITFEYIMIPDINMSDVHLHKLINIARSVNCRINLIPLNTTLQGWRRPTQEEITNFHQGLSQAGILAFNRGSPGLSIDAACGMLALKNIPKVETTTESMEVF